MTSRSSPYSQISSSRKGTNTPHTAYSGTFTHSRNKNNSNNNKAILSNETNTIPLPFEKPIPQQIQKHEKKHQQQHQAQGKRPASQSFDKSNACKGDRILNAKIMPSEVGKGSRVVPPTTVVAVDRTSKNKNSIIASNTPTKESSVDAKFRTPEKNSLSSRSSVSASSTLAFSQQPLVVGKKPVAASSRLLGLEDQSTSKEKEPRSNKGSAADEVKSSDINVGNIRPTSNATCATTNSTLVDKHKSSNIKSNAGTEVVSSVSRKSDSRQIMEKSNVSSNQNNNAKWILPTDLQKQQQQQLLYSKIISNNLALFSGGANFLNRKSSSIPPIKKSSNDSSMQLSSITPDQVLKAMPKDASCVFHILDRRVNFDAFPADTSFYSLLRAWVQDDPYRRTPPDLNLMNHHNKWSNTVPPPLSLEEKESYRDDQVSPKKRPRLELCATLFDQNGPSETSSATSDKPVAVHDQANVGSKSSDHKLTEGKFTVGNNNVESLRSIHVQNAKKVKERKDRKRRLKEAQAWKRLKLLGIELL